MVMHNIYYQPWDAWNRKMERLLVRPRTSTPIASAGKLGPQRPDQGPMGRPRRAAMMTSLSALTLEVYYRYLPLYPATAPDRLARTNRKPTRRGRNRCNGGGMRPPGTPPTTC